MSLRLPSLAYRLLLAWVFLLSLGGGHAWANVNIGVLYPAVQEPFFSVFQNILRGIEATPGVVVKHYPLPEEFDSRPVEAWLQREQIDTVIALGRQGLAAAQALNNKRPVVVGALPITPGGFAGVSLSPDPAVLFQHLKELAPSVRRVHIVHSESSAWLVKRAEAEAKSHGLRLSSYPAGDLREAVNQYRTLLQSIRGTSEAIWLPLDNITAGDDVILPMVLQAAWERSLVVFSSKPPHAQRGALFSVVPDNVAMGQRLGGMAAAAALDRRSVAQVVPLGELQVAVNLRTAFHLGLRFTPRQQERFDLVFPSR